MSARIFVHPRCVDGPANGALFATLDERGINMDNIRIGPLLAGHHRELVRYISDDAGVTTYERMDGTRFNYREHISSPPMGAA